MPLPTKPEDVLKAKLGNIQLKSKENEAVSTAASLGVPYVSLEGFPIGPETISSIPEEQARALGVVCFFLTDKEVRLGAADPAKPEIKELAYQMSERTHANVVIYLISEASLGIGLSRYATVPVIKKIVKGVSIKEEELAKYQAGVASFKDLQKQLTDVATTELVTILIASALRSDASDIHIEAEQDKIVVRFRLDGILHDVAELPKERWVQMISRIKLLAGLKLNITATPQDGRFSIFMKSGDVDVRTSTIPTSEGESVVMRLLRGAGAGLTVEGLGLRAKPLEILKKNIERPNGMIITTGPTGSGKTTTLYGVIRTLNDPETKIITLEDPVEYKLAGVNQSQIDPSKEYTFAKGLRSILRQDPDIILIGELRDLETAETAIQAALTGHLVLSTIHTNSASGAIPRFLALGVKPFLLAPAINLIIAQRLVRKICEQCKQPDALAPDVLKRVQDSLGALPTPSGEKIDVNNLKFQKGAGCSVCNGLGFKGRMGIYELLPMSKEIEGAILAPEGMSEYKMQELAVSAGMVTMTQDGLLKALDGITSVDEVFRVAE